MVQGDEDIAYRFGGFDFDFTPEGRLILTVLYIELRPNPEVSPSLTRPSERFISDCRMEQRDILEKPHGVLPRFAADQTVACSAIWWLGRNSACSMQKASCSRHQRPGEHLIRISPLPAFDNKLTIAP
jgi:hypothetical protein